MDDKSLIEFLKLLKELISINIDYLNGNEVKSFKLDIKYKKEISQVQDLINGFNFSKSPPINPLLISHPVPKEIRDIFCRKNPDNNK